MLFELPRPVIFADRGASAYAPENTLSSFNLAVAQGADAIELDANLSADGQVVVFHDLTLDRTTNGSGRLSQKTLAELRDLDAGINFPEKFRSEKIPLLEEVFEAVGKKIAINVEFKNYGSRRDQLVEKVCSLVIKYGLEGSVIFSSFFPDTLKKASRSLPRVPCALLAPKGWKGAWSRSFGFTFGEYAALHPYFTDVNMQQIQRVHRLKRRVHAWTVNKAEDIRHLKDWGVDGIITDDPLMALHSTGRADVIPSEWIEQAEARIGPHIQKTPLTKDPQRGLIIKWENHQVTGSFKPRGALNKVLSLEEWERKAGLVAASAGNHGQGVALAGRLTGANVEVFVSEHAVPAKIKAMQELGAKITFVKGGYAEAESAGREYSRTQHKVFISPYNDGQVIAGQATIGLEILREFNEPVTNWIVPTGGGGLIAGLGALLNKHSPRPKLIGVQAEASPFTYQLFHSHTQVGVQDLPTLADGLSGAVEEGSVTIPMIEEYVDDFLVVPEEEIERAMAFVWAIYHEKIEGSAAVGLAAVLSGKIKEGPSVVIITGGNVQPEVHEKIIERFAGVEWN